MTQAEHIQGILRERVTDLDNHILTKEGVYAEINLEEGGLNEAEGSYGGVHPNTWNEYKETFALQVTLEKPADFENITPEAAATHIVNFKNWYFQKPPKQNFFELPPLLWLVACDNAYLAPAPVISRIQILCGDPKPDGIWGSGTTELVKGFFHEKTVPRIVNFAKELTELMVKRYEELGGYDAYADSAPHWIERCKRKLQMLYDYVSKQNELADAGVDEEESTTVNVTLPTPPEGKTGGSVIDGRMAEEQPRMILPPPSTGPADVVYTSAGVSISKPGQEANPKPEGGKVLNLEEQPAPEAPNDDLLGLAAIIDNQANVIDSHGKTVERLREMMLNSIESQSSVINTLAQAIDEQGNVITEMKDALLSHITAQEQILQKLLEDTSTDEQPPAKQPTAGRDLLNEVPDSLVQS